MIFKIHIQNKVTYLTDIVSIILKVLGKSLGLCNTSTLENIYSL